MWAFLAQTYHPPLCICWWCVLGYPQVEAPMSVNTKWELISTAYSTCSDFMPHLTCESSLIYPNDLFLWLLKLSLLFTFIMLLCVQSQMSKIISRSLIADYRLFSKEMGSFTVKLMLSDGSHPWPKCKAYRNLQERTSFCHMYLKWLLVWTYHILSNQVLLSNSHRKESLGQNRHKNSWNVKCAVAVKLLEGWSLFSNRV